MVQRHEFENGQNWYGRGFLPHYDAANKYQMITYRLADSLPKEVYGSISPPGSTGGSPVKTHTLIKPGSTGGSPVKNSGGSPVKPSFETKNATLERRKAIESLLDKGYGSCILKNPKIAQIVIDNWQYFDGERYDLIAYVVMPNHVHLLIKTYEGWPLSKVVHSWKSFTAHEIKKVLDKEDRMGGGKDNTGEPPVLPGEGFPVKVWQIEYWDRFIRDEKHFNSALSYIFENPCKAGLCEKPEDWPWTSLNRVDEWSSHYEK